MKLNPFKIFKAIGQIAELVPLLISTYDEIDTVVQLLKDDSKESEKALSDLAANLAVLERTIDSIVKSLK
jgi:uncharacterized protein Yka (UPF0111/DUF47 family)